MDLCQACLSLKCIFQIITEKRFTIETLEHTGCDWRNQRIYSAKRKGNPAMLFSWGMYFDIQKSFFGTAISISCLSRASL